MRRWILILLITLCASPLMAQDNPSESAASTVFFLAREDTDQDGQVTDVDNVRLYEVALDGTLLFVTPPELHVLIMTANPDRADPVRAAWVAQEIEQSLWLNILTGEGIFQNTFWISLADYALITSLDTTEDGIRWTGILQTGETRTEVQATATGARFIIVPEPDQPTPVVDVPGRKLLVQQSMGEIGTLVQDLAAESPLDALWLYEINTQTLTALKTWIPIEPLLFATYKSQMAVLGYELDGSMSL